MGIGERTFYEWAERFPQFAQAIKRGKAPVDMEVENSLLKRALGYEYEEVTTEIYDMPDGKQRKHVRRVKKFLPPDPVSMIFWLKNRKPQVWRDKPEPPVSSEALERLDEVLSNIKGVV